MEKNHIYFKILIIGETGVGKTSILNRIFDGGYVENCESSLGTDYQIKILRDFEKKTVRIQFWDIIGSCSSKFKI